jgi:hypothetical protein
MIHPSPKPKRRNEAARQRAKHERAYGPEDRNTWLHSLPCIVTGRRPVVAAHVVAGGIGFKAGAEWLVPMIDAKHQELHRIGRTSFELKYNVDLRHEAIRVDAAWQAHKAGA